LEAVLRGHGQKPAAEEVTLSEADVQRLDGLSQVSVDKIMSQFVPFRPPPVPMPFDQAVEFDPSPIHLQELAVQSEAVKQRAWSTAVVVTESTDAAGKRTYSATTAPMIEITLPSAGDSQELDDFEIRQPFLKRMRQRQNTNTRYREQRPGILAISVKRQRKLKMKKHKYKKLMKRTRLQRRKLDRA